MNYQDVTPDFLVWNGVANAADFTLNNGVISIKVNNAGVTVPVTYSLIQSTNGGAVAPTVGTAAQWTITTTTIANTSYSVNFLQIIDGVVVERQITYTTPAAPVANAAAIGLDAIIDKLVALGVFEITSSVRVGDVITVTASVNNASLKISNGQNTVVANSVPAITPKGQGADLTSIVDLNGVSPVAGTEYYSLKLDYQTDRIGLEGASRFQRKSLIMLYDDTVAEPILTPLIDAILEAEAPVAGQPIEQIALQG